MTSAATAKLHTPRQDLQAPTHFDASSEALAGWLETLPKANLGETTRALYHAVTELNRVRLAPALRLQLLETLRPAIHFATAGLRRHYLNQPTVLPEQPQKVARLAHVLHEELATGYILVAVQALALGRQHSGFTQLPEALATAAHRGIVEHSMNLLRDCQLYRAPHPGCWNTIHQLALLAREYDADKPPVADSQCGDGSVSAAYLRALLLGSAKTNQLRQEDLAKLFQQLLEWTSLARLGAPQHTLLVVDPDGDDGPVYREFTAAGDDWLGLDTQALAKHLEALRESGDTSLSDDLLAHLIHTWSSASKRAFLRLEVNERVDIALGLTATHHFIAGEIDFSVLLSSEGHNKLALAEENPFLRVTDPTREAHQQRDVWDSAYQPRAGLAQVSMETIDYHIREQHSKTAGSREREKFRFHSVARINISPGGLCIKWPPDDPSQIRTGEIIGIREDHHKNWSVGVVRWLRLLESGPQLGIELLSPTAVPYGARVVHKSGPQGEYLRVLILPEIKQTGQATTLIAPRLPFRTGQRVSLLHRDRETRIQLTRKIASTAAFSQFEFRRLSGLKASDTPTAKTAAGDGDFEGLWNNL